jgi:hypothetical protein
MPFADVAAYDRFAAAMVSVPANAADAHAKAVLTLGLIHPDRAVAARAVQRRRYGPSVTAAPEMTGTQRRGALRQIDELAEEWVAVWSAWAGGLEGGQRARAEDASCPRLADAVSMLVRRFSVRRRC